MFRDIDFLTQTSAMARHASKRHDIVAQNIANADTPFYKAQTLPAFDPGAVTRARAGSDIELRKMMQPIDIPGAEASPNGNTVSLDAQMAESVDAQAQHETALAFYRKAMDLLRLSLRAPR